MGSNAIIDSGTNSIQLPNYLMEDLLKAFRTQNFNFFKAIAIVHQNNNSLSMEQLDLSKWPNLICTFEGENGQPIQLICQPTTYWQLNTPSPGMATFKLVGKPKDSPNQSIFGLPLLNNYFTIFDRSKDSKGVIKFASINKALP